jgi:hypothetical protein
MDGVEIVSGGRGTAVLGDGWGSWAEAESAITKATDTAGRIEGRMIFSAPENTAAAPEIKPLVSTPTLGDGLKIDPQP